MRINVTLDIDAEKILRERGLGESNRVQQVLASEVKRQADPYVPMQQGILKNTAQDSEDGSEIVYNQPYAKYQYYGKVMRDANGRAFYGGAPKHVTDEDIQYHDDGTGLRGAHWIERMMADKKEEILDTVAREVGGKAK